MLLAGFLTLRFGLGMKEYIKRQALEILRSRGWLNWSALDVGWGLRFIGPQVVVGFAVETLVNDYSQDDDMIVELAGMDVQQHRRIESLLTQLASRELDESSTLSRVDVEDRWRFGVLLALEQEEFTDERERLLDIDEVASLFGYPRDMKNCIYYNRSATSPFEAFRRLVSSLSARLGEMDIRIADDER